LCPADAISQPVQYVLFGAEAINTLLSHQGNSMMRVSTHYHYCDVAKLIVNLIP
jgi:hypothetical protein